MKKFAALSIALAVLAATPALARARHHQQPQQYQSSTYGQVDPGYWRLWEHNNLPFAPF